MHRVDLPPVDRTIKHGIPVTTPARTLLDVASELPLRDLEAAVARAEREGLVTREQLFALLKRNVGRRGARALRAVLRIAGGPALTRSEAEERFLALVREADLPPPECNAKVGAYEIDFLWRRQAIAVEVDGYLYHSGRTRFDGDRRRDARLLAQGITVLRLSWRQITQEAVATGAQLAVALCRAESR